MTAHVEVPAILLPYQQRWIADKSQVKIADKSRRIGITWATALEGVLTAAMKTSERGTDVWYSVNNEDDAREFIEDSATWTRGLGMLASDIGEVMIEDEDRDILAFRIRYASGNKITALSSNARRLRGKDGYSIKDEAAHAEDLDEFMKAAKAFVMWGTGRLALISTHNGVMSAFNQMIESVRAGSMKASVHRVTIHEALHDGLFRRMCYKNRVEWTQEAEDRWLQDLMNLYGDDAGEELLCIPSGAGGRYLHRKVIEQCTDQSIPVIRLKVEDDFATQDESSRRLQVQRWLEQHVDPVLSEIGADHQLYFGEDFGRRSDLTVLCPMTVEQDMTRRIPFLIELRNVPIDQQKQVIFHVLDNFASRQKLIGGIFDAGGNGQYVAEAASLRYGTSRIRQTYLAGGPPREDKDRHTSAGDAKPSLRYSEALPPLKARLEDRGIAIPQDRDVVHDLEMFERVNGLPVLPAVRVKGQDREYRHGDAGVAIMLAHYATIDMSPMVTTGYVGIPSVERHADVLSSHRSIKRGSRGVFF